MACSHNAAYCRLIENARLTSQEKKGEELGRNPMLPKTKAPRINRGAFLYGNNDTA